MKNFKIIIFSILSNSCGTDCDEILQEKHLILCPNDNLMKWNGFPLKIEVAQPSNFNLQESVQSGIDRWHQDVNLPLFTLEKCENCPVIKISKANKEKEFELRNNYGKNAIAIAFPYGSLDTCLFISSEIFVFENFQNVSKISQASIIQHELGHILGLGHDCGISLMGGDACGKRNKKCRASIGHINWIKNMFSVAKN